MPKRSYETADVLAAQGYRRVSRKHRMLARVDRPDWREALAKHYRSGDLEAGMRWASGRGMADFYRRVLSKDVIEVSEEVSLAVPGSGWGETGYVDLDPHTTSEVPDVKTQIMMDEVPTGRVRLSEVDEDTLRSREVVFMAPSSGNLRRLHRGSDGYGFRSLLSVDTPTMPSSAMSFQSHRAKESVRAALAHGRKVFMFTSGAEAARWWLGELELDR